MSWILLGQSLILLLPCCRLERPTLETVMPNSHCMYTGQLGHIPHHKHVTLHLISGSNWWKNSLQWRLSFSTTSTSLLWQICLFYLPRSCSYQLSINLLTSFPHIISYALQIQQLVKCKSDVNSFENANVVNADKRLLFILTLCSNHAHRRFSLLYKYIWLQFSSYVNFIPLLLNN